MTESIPNFYLFLGIPRTAAPDEVIQAFRKKAAVVNGAANGSAESARDLQLLGQAYRTLTDADRRRQYDGMLPAEEPKEETTASTRPTDWRSGNVIFAQTGPEAGREMYLEEEEETEPADQVQQQARTIWKAVAKEYLEKAERYTPALDGVKIVKPITIEAGKQMILGHEPRFANLIGYLSTGENFNLLRRMMCEKAGRSLDIRFVETTSLNEWKIIRDAERKVHQRQSMRVQSRIRTNDSLAAMEQGSEGTENWDDVMTGIEEWPASNPNPTAQARAVYILQNVAMIARAEENSRYCGTTDEALKAQVDKALTRISTLTGIDATIIALEYYHCRLRG